MEQLVARAVVKLQQKDYRSFLLIATFGRSPMLIPFLLILSLGGAYWLCRQNFQWGQFLLSWIFLILMVVIVLSVQIFARNRGRKEESRPLQFLFYPAYLEVSDERGASRIPYEKLSQVLESRKYLIFYLDNHLALILPKQDLQMRPEAMRTFLKGQVGEKYKSTFL